MKKKLSSLLIWVLSLLMAGSASAARYKVLDVPFSGVQIYSRDSNSGIVTPLISKQLGINSSSILGEWYAGYTSDNDLIELSGSGRNLADANAPLFGFSSWVDNTGNSLRSFVYSSASSQYHSLAHSAWMNVFTTDHNLTFLLNLSTTGAGTEYIFSHGESGQSGLIVYVDGASIYATWSRAGGSTTISKTLTRDGLDHLVHVGRTGNLGYIYVDADSGSHATLNVADGKDATEVAYLGCYRGPASYLNGSISYFRWQTASMSYDQVRRENNLFTGIGGASGSTFIPFSFKRSSTSSDTTNLNYVDRKTGNCTLKALAANTPTIDDGLVTGTTSTNYYKYDTEIDNAAWTKSNCTVTANNAVAPDGSSTAELFVESAAGAGDVAHTIYLASDPSTSASNYLQNWYVKYKTSGREWVYLRDEDANKNAFFNIRTGTVGTVSGSTQAFIEPTNNDWYRITHSFTTATANDTLKFGSASADNTLTYTGDERQAFWIWGPNYTGSMSQTFKNPITYIDSPANRNISRVKDIFAFIPWKMNQDLAPYVAATPMMKFTGSETITDTVTSTTGSYSFTTLSSKAKNETEWGSGFRFFGANNWPFSSGGGGASDFNPAGNFSIVAVVSLEAVGGTIISKTGSSPNYGWKLTQTGNYFNFSVSINGTSWKTANGGPSSPIIHKPYLITATYHTVDGVKIRVDDFTVGTQAASGTVKAVADSPYIAGESSSSYWNGTIYYLGYYNGYEISATEHNNAYAAFRTDGILPVTMSSTSDRKKLYVEFDGKDSFSSSGVFFGIKNSEYKNFVYTTASPLMGLRTYINGGDGVDHYMSANLGDVDFNKWHKYKIVIDFTDLSNSNQYVDGVSEKDTTSSLSGTESIDFGSDVFYVGSYSDAGSNVQVKNLQVWTE